MIILLDTSTPVCKLTVVKPTGEEFSYSWQADRNLAKGLLGYIRDTLAKHDSSWQDITGIGAFAGPGSFTGLRIGLTVLNTLADSEQIAIVGETGEDWKENALSRLTAGENDEIVLPFYGGTANITAPRK